MACKAELEEWESHTVTFWHEVNIKAIIQTGEGN